MSLEYAPNKIRINAVAPTVIVTEPIQKLIDTKPDVAKALITNSNPLLGPGNLPLITKVWLPNSVK